jgi:hypothetical protein
MTVNHGRGASPCASSEAALRGTAAYGLALLGHRVTLLEVLTQMAQVLRAGGRAALVLGNVQYVGTPVDVDSLTAEIAEQAGFRTNKIVFARRRGNSAQQKKTHGRHPQRESVVLLEKGP